MKQQLILDSYEQLKAISDPLRIQILSYTIERAYTGKQLSELLGMSAPKVHYHLKELEQAGLLEVVDTEIKNGIVQKFYKSVAYDLFVSERLLPHQQHLQNNLKETLINLVSRAKMRIATAPEEAFQWKKSKELTPIVASQYEVRIREDKLLAWLEKYRSLKQELMAMHDEESEEAQWFYLANAGCYIDEPLFEKTEEDMKNEQAKQTP